eukprot:2796795-Pyramimonas_sp.AAC.2
MILLVYVQAVRVKVARSRSQEHRAPEGRVFPSLTRPGRWAPDGGRNRTERGRGVRIFKNT